MCIKQTYVYVCMLIEVVETVSLRYIHCLEWHHLATMGFFSTPISEFCFSRVCNNHMFNPCLFLKYLLWCNCRSRGDCVTIYWHALCEHGITASHFLLHLPWTHSCGTILSRNDISCQLTSLEFLSSHPSQRGWHVGIMAMVQWLNLL